MADTTPPLGDNVHEALRALPKTDIVSTINERAALAARLHIKENHQALHKLLRTHIDTILENIKPQLDKLETSEAQATHYVIREDELRAVVARSINAGAMQTAHSIGHALHAAEHIAKETSTDI